MEKARELIELHSTLFKEKKSAYSSIYMKIYQFELSSNLETKPSKSENFFQAGTINQNDTLLISQNTFCSKFVIKELVERVIFPFEE